MICQDDGLVWEHEDRNHLLVGWIGRRSSQSIHNVFEEVSPGNGYSSWSTVFTANQDGVLGGRHVDGRRFGRGESCKVVVVGFDVKC